MEISLSISQLSWPKIIGINENTFGYTQNRDWQVIHVRREVTSSDYSVWPSIPTIMSVSARYARSCFSLLGALFLLYHIRLKQLESFFTYMYVCMYIPICQVNEPLFIMEKYRVSHNTSQISFNQ